MYINSLKKAVLVFSLIVGAAFVASEAVYADCEPTYGGGQTCIYNKNFKVEKKVRIEGDDDWEDKVVGVDKGDVVEFRIKIKNTGEVDVDDMKYKDILPDEMERVGGDGLTEYWDDFDTGDTEEFVIKAKIDSDEFDKKNFEKCVVNKVEVYYDDKFEGADTATVCYGDSDIKELPKTGADASAMVSFAGLSLIALGTLVKKKFLA